jgi:hypothetical protein
MLPGRSTTTESQDLMLCRIQQLVISRRARGLVLGVMISGLLLGACAAHTKLDQAWTAPSAQNQSHPPLQRVVTLFQGQNITLRRVAEDRLAHDFVKRGVEATPSYAIFENQDVSNLDAVKAKLRDMGYDGIVTMRIADRETSVEYSPSSFDDPWGSWGYAGVGYGGWYGPGYAYTETTYRVEANAYSLQTGQLVWSGTTKSVDPSPKELVNGTSKIISGELTKRGLAG